jgi:NhaP-type Na+/H+ or K+/H+ antiporter
MSMIIMTWLPITAFFLLLVSWVTKKLHHSYGVLALICLVFGIGLGYFHRIPSFKTVSTIGEISLIVFLFIDGIHLHFPKIFHYHREGFRQMTIGFMIQLFFGLILAHYLLEISWIHAAYLACPLAAIDFRSIPYLIQDEKIPSRIRKTLSLESSGTSVFALILLMVFYLCSPLMIFFSFGIGVVMGVCLTFVIRILLKGKLADASFLLTSLLIAPFSLFYFCKLIGWNGYMAVASLALTLGHLGRSFCGGSFDFGRKEGTLLFFLLIIVFGAHLPLALGGRITWEMVVYGALSLFIIRLIGVVISFLGSQFQKRTMVFYTFFGPRSVLPILAALTFFSSALPVYANLYLTVLISLIFHSIFSFSMTYWYTRGSKNDGLAETVPTVFL